MSTVFQGFIASYPISCPCFLPYNITNKELNQEEKGHSRYFLIVSYICFIDSISKQVYLQVSFKAFAHFVNNIDTQ